VTAFDEAFQLWSARLSRRADIEAEAGMIGNVMSDGRLLSLQATEWLILIVGGLAGSLILMF
jgi:hypothetical protein